MSVALVHEDELLSAEDELLSAGMPEAEVQPEAWSSPETCGVKQGHKGSKAPGFSHFAQSADTTSDAGRQLAENVSTCSKQWRTGRLVTCETGPGCTVKTILIILFIV